MIPALYNLDHSFYIKRLSSILYIAMMITRLTLYLNKILLPSSNTQKKKRAFLNPKSLKTPTPINLSLNPLSLSLSLSIFPSQKTMSYCHKEMVEICKKREGFSADAYYLKAIFLASMGGTRCLVQYQTRFEEDRARLKTELVKEEDVRPLPPPPASSTTSHTSNYVVSQKVDAYGDGAWWVGRVSRMDDHYCHVRLDINGSELKVPFFRIRDHVEWRHGHWVPSAPSRAYVHLPPSPLSFFLSFYTHLLLQIYYLQ